MSLGQRSDFFPTYDNKDNVLVQGIVWINMLVVFLHDLGVSFLSSAFLCCGTETRQNLRNKNNQREHEAHAQATFCVMSNKLPKYIWAHCLPILAKYMKG